MWERGQLKPALIINQFLLRETLHPAVLHGTGYAKNLTVLSSRYVLM